MLYTVGSSVFLFSFVEVKSYYKGLDQTPDINITQNKN